MNKSNQKFAKWQFVVVFLVGYFNHACVFANQESESLKALSEAYLIQKNHLKSEIISKENKSTDSNLQADFPSLPDLCNPAPISTTAEGPVVTRDYSWFDEKFKMEAWRYPCDEDFSYVIITVKPQSPSVFICSSQITLVQNGVQNDDFKLVQDPINNDSSHCDDVYIDTGFAVQYWSFATRNIDLQSSFEMYWDLGDNTQHFTMFAYDPNAYGIGGDPPPPTLSNDAGVNGLFYDPSNSGHGFDIVRHESGLIVYYYGHTASGERLWLISDNYQGDLDYNDEFRIDMYEIAAGDYGHPNSPATKWGSLYLEFDDCDSGSASLNGTDGLLSMDFVRLVRLPDMNCE